MEAMDRMDNKPLLVVISANGVLDNGPRDYPLALTPLYRWMLRGVFDDKRKMEDIVAGAGRRLGGGFVVVRPSVLVDGPSKGISVIRQGTTNDPVQGFSISREDVGLWMYEMVIKPEDRSAFPIMNTGVQITY
jgi:hypothetical protein